MVFDLLEYCLFAKCLANTARAKFKLLYNSFCHFGIIIEYHPLKTAHSIEPPTLLSPSATHVWSVSRFFYSVPMLLPFAISLTSVERIVNLILLVSY